MADKTPFEDMEEAMENVRQDSNRPRVLVLSQKQYDLWNKYHDHLLEKKINENKFRSMFNEVK